MQGNRKDYSFSGKVQVIRTLSNESTSNKLTSIQLQQSIHFKVCMEFRFERYCRRKNNVYKSRKLSIMHCIASSLSLSFYLSITKPISPPFISLSLSPSLTFISFSLLSRVKTTSWVFIKFNMRCTIYNVGN